MQSQMDNWHGDEEDFKAAKEAPEDEAYDRHIENNYLKELNNEQRNARKH